MTAMVFQLSATFMPTTQLINSTSKAAMKLSTVLLLTGRAIVELKKGCRKAYQEKDGAREAPQERVDWGPEIDAQPCGNPDINR